MSKDVNIHIKTPGAEEAKRHLNDVSNATKKMGRDVTTSNNASKQSSKGLLSNLKLMAGSLGFAGLAASAIAAANKIRKAMDDIKQAVNEAVNKLAELQKTSADYFEAFDAYTPGERNNALAQARRFQAKTSLNFESSKKLLETYKRQFGSIDDQEATEQLAGYWQLHGGESTADLIRWLGASGVSNSDSQGKILRLISAVASQTGLRDSEIIGGITRYSTEFKEFGWTPEQTIENIGKALSGLSQREARRGLSGLVEGLKSFDEEKALEMGLSPKNASNNNTRIVLAAMKLRKLEDDDERSKLSQELFGKTYASYVTKFLTERATPEAEKAMKEALMPQAGDKEYQRVLGYRQTAEGMMERAEGLAEEFALTVNEREKHQVATRRMGEGYLETMERRNPLLYHWIKILNLKEGEKERAAKELWVSSLTEEDKKSLPNSNGSTSDYMVDYAWNSFSPEEKRRRVEEAQSRVINNHNEYHTHFDHNYYPRIGDDQRGPRFSQD